MTEPNNNLPQQGGGGGILNFLPFIGNSISSLINRHWAKKDLAAQNLYNSPKEQLKRLKEAGLPAAAFFSGGVSSQSEQPRETTANLGSSEFFEKFAINQVQKKQMQILDEQIRSLDLDNELKEVDLNYWKSVTDRDAEGLPINRQNMTNRQMSLELGIQNSEQDRRVKAVTSYLKETYGEDLTKQELATNDAILDRIKLEIQDKQLFNQFQREMSQALQQPHVNVWTILTTLIKKYLMKAGR